MIIKLLGLLFILYSVDALDNGLALTPPMGWMSWQRYRCVIDCDNYPDDCLSDKLIRDMADRLSEDGFLDAGYEYLIIDDCWLATERDSDGVLQADSKRFPNGMADLGDYIHSKGLKFGIYEDIGTKTCGGYPGIDGNYELDANTFAEWGVDYIKVDGCYQDTEGMEELYAEFGHYLNATGRPIVYSCSFPAYKELKANYTAAVELCNLWRNYGDIDDAWDYVTNIADWFAKNQGFINKFAGPGHWNDPDMLLIGNYGLSFDESIAQMTIWSLLAAPLLLSVDLRTIKPEFTEIALNKDVIKINQDPLGIPGLLSYNKGNIYVWIKPISPKVDENYSYGLGVVNYATGGGPDRFVFTLDSFGLDSDDGYTVKNIFEPTDPVTVSPLDEIEIRVNPSGAVLFQINPLSGQKTDKMSQKVNNLLRR